MHFPCSVFRCKFLKYTTDRMSFSRVRTIKPQPGWVKPTVEIVERDGSQYLLKDYGACSGRLILSKYFAQREYDVLRKLQGIKGIPGDVQLIGGSKLLREYVSGGYLKQEDPQELPNSFYHELRRLVNEMHERNIVHLDLRHMKNIVVHGEDEPCLIDFETAVNLNYLSMLPELKRILRWVDHSALLRIKNRYFSHLMSEADRDRIRNFYRWRRFWVFSPFYLRDKDRVREKNEEEGEGN